MAPHLCDIFIEYILCQEKNINNYIYAVVIYDGRILC